jgi:hypothetical protein
VAGGQQHADGFPVATPARLGQVVAAERLAGRSDGVQVIGLGASGSTIPAPSISDLVSSAQRLTQTT